MADPKKAERGAPDARGVEMVALMSRGAGGPGPALMRGESYLATDAEARADEQRGYGRRATVKGDQRA